MIRINLAPATELESRYWWVPEAVSFVVATTLIVGGIFYYRSLIEDEIARLNQESQNLQEAYAGLKSDLAQYDETQGKIRQLEQMRDAMIKITESKLDRYMPIILLEHLQTLKPEGLWLSDLSFKKVTAAPGTIPEPPPVVAPTEPPPEGQEGAAQEAVKPADVPPPLVSTAGKENIEINGYAFDNLLLAEFMTVLKATRHQDTDASDLRTQLFFDAVNLEFSDLKSFPRRINDQEMPIDVVGFKLIISYQARQPDQQAVDMKLSRMMEKLRATRQQRATW